MPSHHATGFWGPVEANHSFCEPHYAVSPYIAEFFNSTSSIIYILLALCVRFPNDSLLRAAQVWLLAVGVGSILFHGTMRYVFQLADEIPMVGFLATLMVAKISTPHPLLNNGYIWMAKTLVLLFSVALITVYVVLDQYEIFIHGFTFMVLVDTVLTLTLLNTSGKWGKVELRAYIVSFVSIILGRIVWESEHLLCPSYPQVWPLHVVWHLCSCLSAYMAMVTVYVIRAGKDTTTKLPRFVGFEDLIPAASSTDKKVE